MKILVLGGAGFIGSHIVEGLISQGHQVRVLDRASRSILDGVETINVDISDVMALSEALVGIDTVIHLISTSVPSTSNKDPISDVQGNLINTLKLLDVMRQMDVRRIIYFSSGGTVYGVPSEVPIKEIHPTNPICSYGIVKLTIEKYLHMYTELYGIDATILRPSNPYGPGQGHMGVQGFIGTCIHSALTNSKLTIWGDGSVIRDYLFISDMVSATLATLNLPHSGIYNISSGIGYSLNEVIKIVEEKTKKRIVTDYKVKRDFDVQEIILDNQQAKSKLNWSPSISLKTGIEKTINAIVTKTNRKEKTDA